ncbi:MAG: helix-turn-helix transcriptional regulator [bacterium]|nr:helix-turn-helix transcriptional regulator [bacterium]
MHNVERQVDRVLTLLQDKIRGRGFTQLQIQDALGWGRSYISQLVTKQKSLRVEQVLLILQVIGIEPADFFGELYLQGGVHRAGPWGGPPPVQTEQVEEIRHGLADTRAMLASLLQVLTERGVITRDDLAAAAGED